MKFEDSSAVCVIDSHHGQYIGQIFAQMYEPYLRKQISKDALDSLLLGPEKSDMYFDMWADLEGIKLTNEEGKSFRFCQIDGDIFEIPEEEYHLIDWESVQ